VDHDDDADARHGDNTHNIVPFKPRNPAVVTLSDLASLAKAARSAPPPPRVRKALSAFPKGQPVWALHTFKRHRLRLPYGRWITDDGTRVLYNRKYQPLLIWQPGTDKAERCDPHWVTGIAAQDWFYIDASVVNVSDGSLAVIGRSDLYRALESLIDTWIRGDRATADAVEAWLLGKREQYLKLVEQKKAEIARRGAETKRMREEYELLVRARPSAKPE
jgi:hypothetical protein